MPIPIKSLLRMPKLLSERIRNGTIGDLLNLIRQLNDFDIGTREFDMDYHLNDNIKEWINDNDDRKVRYLALIIMERIGYLLLQKSPKVDHREWDRMKQLMNDIGFQVFKINKDGEERGVQLSVGDYEQSLSDGDNGKIVVERKANDFLASVFSYGSNLDEQLSNIVSDDNIITGFLILDKSFDDLLDMAKERKISENVVYGSIASLCLKGFPPLFIGNSENFRNIVDKIFHKVWDGKERIYVPKIRIGKGKAIVVFPGVDEAIGARLLERFGSIRNIINATEGELSEVRGIGKVIARKIIGLINNEKEKLR